jgi:proteasome lid subunit RPN8/RPN11
VELEVTSSLLTALREEAARAAPEECCGLLLGRAGEIGEARPAANVAPDPIRRFEIDPQSLVDAHRAARNNGPEVLGYYHSHPGGPAVPSATDRAQAAGDGSVWAIVGEDGVTFWRDEEAGFAPLSYAVADR